MKLREKFETKSSIDTTKEARIFASECEKIAEDFAIGFAEWSVIRKVSFFDDTEQGMIFTVDLYKTKYTTKELLEIYKIEKGL